MKIVRAEGRQLLEPAVDIVNQSFFVVVDVNPGGYVHGGNQHQAIADPTGTHNLFHLRSNVHVLAMLFRIETQIVSMEFHDSVLLRPASAVYILASCTCSTARASVNSIQSL